MNRKFGLLILLTALLISSVACGSTTNNTTPISDVTTLPATPVTIPPTQSVLTPIATAQATLEPAASPTLVPTEPPTQPGSDARTEILAAYERTLHLSYRTVTVSPGTDGDTIITGEIVPPDALHTLTQTPSLTIEMVIIGTSGWQAVNGVWNPLPIEMVNTVSTTAFPAAILAVLEETITNPQALGQEQLNGQSVWVYTFSGLSSHTTLYVDIATGLPVQQIIISDSSGVTSTQTITYDEGIVITPPVSN